MLVSFIIGSLVCGFRVPCSLCVANVIRTLFGNSKATIGMHGLVPVCSNELNSVGMQHGSLRS